MTHKEVIGKRLAEQEESTAQLLTLLTKDTEGDLVTSKMHLHLAIGHMKTAFRYAKKSLTYRG